MPNILSIIERERNPELSGSSPCIYSVLVNNGNDKFLRKICFLFKA